jgi:hypothetical protein
MPRSTTASRPASASADRPDATIDVTQAEQATPAPRPLTELEHADLERAGVTGQAPTLTPPGVDAGVTTIAAGGVTGTWTSGVKVNALWAQYSTRNAYMSVANVGWLKVFNGTDAAFLALTTLASQAKQSQTQIAYRTEADGMVHEIYLW